MRHIFILLLTLIGISNSFSQVRIDVWNTSTKKTGSTIPNPQVGKIPNSFQSMGPDTQIIKYSKVKERIIKVETSDGIKFDFRTNLYKSSDGESVITYSEKKGWLGFYNGSKQFYNLSNGIVTNDLTESIKSNKPISIDSTKNNQTISLEKCIPIILNNKQNKKVSKTPQVSKTPNNPLDFYNPLIIISKRCSVRVEISYSANQFFGGGDVVETLNYFSTLYEGVSTIFSREGIILNMTSSYIWTEQDPYPSIPSVQAIISYQNDLLTHTDYDHFKQLITSHPTAQGGLAYLNGAANGSTNPLPSLSPQNCVSHVVLSQSSENLNNYYTNLQYFQPLHYISHELGHNLGSRHTHWCGWKNESNNWIGPLDQCADVEPAVGSPCNSNVPFDGTIMSYCESPYKPYRKNILKIGFGKYPRWSIRNNLYYSNDIPLFEGGGTLPTVQTGTPSLITTTGFTINDNLIVSDGGSQIIQKGICYSTDPDPDLSDNIVLESSYSDNFSIVFSNFFGNQTFYLKAFATNDVGTSFGQEVVVTTQNPGVLVPIIDGPTNITSVSARFSSYIPGSLQGNLITRSGFCWSTNSPPTVDDSFQDFGVPTSNSWSGYIGPLTPNTTYFVKSYVGNSNTIYYSAQRTVTTLNNNINFISVLKARRYKSIVVDVNMTGSGGQPILERGVCWSYTNSQPTIDDVLVVDESSSLGVNTTNLINLDENQTIHLRPFFRSTNNQVFYGNTVTTSTLNPSDLTISFQGTGSFQGTYSWGESVEEVNGYVPYLKIGFSNEPYPNVIWGLIASISNPSPTFESLDYRLTRGYLSGDRKLFALGNNPPEKNIFWFGVDFPPNVPIYVRGYFYGEFGKLYYTEPILVTTPCHTRPQSLFPFNDAIPNYPPGFKYFPISFASRKQTPFTNYVLGMNSELWCVYAPKSCNNSTVNQVGWYSGPPWTGADQDIPKQNNSDFISPTIKEDDKYYKIITPKDYVQYPRTSIYPLNYRSVKSESNNNVSNKIYGEWYVSGGFVLKWMPKISLDNIEYLSPTSIKAKCRVIDVGGLNFPLNLALIGKVGFYIYKSEIFESMQSNTATSDMYEPFKIGEVACTNNCNSPQNFEVIIDNLDPNQSYNIITYGTSTVDGTPYTYEFSYVKNGTQYYLPQPLGINCPQMGLTWTIKFKLSDFNKIETTQPIYTSQGTVFSGGKVITSNSPVTNRGICWSTYSGPTINLPTKTSDGTGTGIFSSQMTNLLPNTMYFVRSYFVNSTGIFYGDQKSFMTPPNNSPPTVETGYAGSIESDRADLTGKVLQTNSPIIERGFCLSKTQNSLLYDGQSVKLLISEGEPFRRALGLTPSTTYYFKFFARNSFGISYGQEKQFTTLGDDLPTITTIDPSIISSTSFLSGGNITDGGNSPVINRGIIWSLSSDNISVLLPTKNSGGSGTGTFTSVVSGLLPNTTYFIKSFATNNSGTQYGDLKSITTPETGNGDCQITDIFVTQNINNIWYYQFPLNINCSNYKVELTKYSGNPTSNPSTPIINTSILNNMNPGTPTSEEITSGLINRIMKPQPSGVDPIFGRWFSLNVKCNGTCDPNTNITKYYFYIAAQ